MVEKRCNKCGEPKLVTEFYRDKSRKDGRSYRMAYRAVRRANEEDAFDEYVDRKVVYWREGGMCGICWKPIKFEDMHLDHIISLSKGGRHNYKNAQSSCAPCNLSKGAKLVTEGGG